MGTRLCSIGTTVSVRAACSHGLAKGCWTRPEYRKHGRLRRADQPDVLCMGCGHGVSRPRQDAVAPGAEAMRDTSMVQQRRSSTDGLAWEGLDWGSKWRRLQATKGVIDSRDGHARDPKEQVRW